jgi:DNA-binding NarL/FixJ family response regulator
MTAAKTVLIIEDDPVVRGSLVKELTYHGFNAKGASNVTEARNLIGELRQQIDVAVLDMSLEDQDHPNLTGADLGREIHKAQPDGPAEILIFSGHSTTEFYNSAFEVDAAAYIKKGTPSARNLIRHIRTLALRRALSPERKEISESVERIAEISYTHADAIMRFCRQVLAPEIKVCLGVRSVLLLSDSKGTQNCVDDPDLPLGYNHAYEKIQALTFGAIDDQGPFIFEGENLSAVNDPQASHIYKTLDGGAFLPLYMTNDLRLSVGILREDKTSNPLAEEPNMLAGILSSNFRTTTLGHLFSVLSQLTGLNAKREAEKNALLEHTSRFCLYVGQTQLDVLNEAVEKREVVQTSEYFQKLKKLAVDLQATGKEFSQLSNKRNRADASAKTDEKASVRSVVAKAWKMIEEQHLSGKLELVQRGEDFELAIEEKDLLVAVLRVLQWMAQREDKIPPDVPGQKIEVACVRQEGRVEISFTDQSRRLGNHLRRKLFEPFTQATTTTVDMENNGEELPGLYLPLYVAKTLIEVKNGGALEDKTKQLESEQGHRFVMSFPVAAEDTSDIETG